MSIYTAEQQAANRQKWVEALRSGEFPQGSGALRGHDVTGVEEFCCLGVACELAVREGVTSRSSEGYYFDGGDGQYEENGALPPEVQDWLGVHEPSGQLKDRIEYDTTEKFGGLPSTVFIPRMTDSLVGLNDDAAWDFNRIADVIESGQVRLQGEAWE